MLGKLFYSIYYGSFAEYNSGLAILIYSSINRNTPSVKVLNDPILDWEVNKAGSITIILDPENAGYSEIVCKKKHIFIKRNEDLIWHGRVIEDSFDENANRELLCEGALNYLLDTHVKPNNASLKLKDTDFFEDLIDQHNRSLVANESVIFGRSDWLKHEQNGTIKATNAEIRLTSTGTTGWNLFIWSNPSIWKYKNYKTHNIRVSFTLSLIGASGSDLVQYGLHLRDTSYAVYNTNRHAIIEGAPLRSSQEVDTFFALGPGGLDGTGHEDAFIGFHIYLNSNANVVAIITNLKVEATTDGQYSIPHEKSFPAREGYRTGVKRIPFSDEKLRAIIAEEYPKTLDVINERFVEPYGGYLYVSYKWNGDYSKEYAILNYIYGDEKRDSVPDDVPEIRFAKNLISCKITNNYAETPTVIIPLGREKDVLECSLKFEDITYYKNYRLDKDGYMEQSPYGTDYVAVVNVSSGDLYFASGQAVDDQGLWSIINSSNEIIDSQNFSADQSTWHTDTEIEIPEGGRQLRIFLYNAHEAQVIDDSIFILKKYVDSDLEKYINLENYTGDRIDDLAGTKYYPVDTETSIYFQDWTEQVIHFEDADTQLELLAQVRQYIRWLEDAKTSYEIEAAELMPISDESECKPLGMPGSYALVNITNLGIDKKLCVTKCSLNLADVSKSKYSLANLPPPDLGDLLAKGMY